MIFASNLNKDFLDVLFQPYPYELGRVTYECCNPVVMSGSFAIASSLLASEMWV